MEEVVRGKDLMLLPSMAARLKSQVVTSGCAPPQAGERL